VLQSSKTSAWLGGSVTDEEAVAEYAALYTEYQALWDAACKNR
jgi:myo-inositol catabolism protein IolC